MIYEYYCNKCNRVFEEFRSVEERHNVFCCDTRAVKLIPSGIFTEKDKSYSFFTEAIDGKPKEVTSKGQYKRLLKQNKIADASPRECFQQAKKCKRYKEESYQSNVRQRAKRIADKMHKNNVVKECVQVLTKKV